MRFAEFGKVHRYEPSGALHGLMRVRAFTQDDAHVFVTEEQITADRVAVTRLILDIYRDFGFDEVRSSSPTGRAKRVGADEVWDRAEAALKAASRAAGIEYTPQSGRGRLLRPEARIRAARCHRPRLAVRHAAGGSEHARPPGRALHRRAQPEARAGHAASGDFRLAGAFFRASCSSTTPAGCPPGSRRCRRW